MKVIYVESHSSLIRPISFGARSGYMPPQIKKPDQKNFVFCKYAVLQKWGYANVSAPELYIMFNVDYVATAV
jgi:hypothetical protein